MKLLDYLKTRQISDEDFAALLGRKISARAVRKWKYGERTPRLPELIRIEELTSGAVAPGDFLSDETEAPQAQNAASAA